MSLPVSGPVFFPGLSQSGRGVSVRRRSLRREGKGGFVRRDPPYNGRAGSTHPIGMLPCNH